MILNLCFSCLHLPDGRVDSTPDSKYHQLIGILSPVFVFVCLFLRRGLTKYP